MEMGVEGCAGLVHRQTVVPCQGQPTTHVHPIPGGGRTCRSWVHKNLYLSNVAM